MKKVFDFIAPAALLVLSAGCIGDLQYEDPVDAPVTHRYELSFDVSTKTALGEGTGNGPRSISWNANDLIYYYTKRNNNAVVSVPVTIENGTGYIMINQLHARDDLFMNAMYSGQATDPDDTGQTPLSVLDDMDARKLSFGVNNIASKDQSFRYFSEAHACVAHLSAVAQSTIYFKTIVSIFKFTLDDDNVKKVVFSAPSETMIINGGDNGLLKVTMSSDGKLVSVVPDPDYAEDASNSISINTSAGVGEYYFSIIPTYFPDGFYIKCYDANNTLIDSKDVHYKKPLVAGIDAEGNLCPTITSLGSVGQWKTTEEPVITNPVTNLTLSDSSLDLLVDDEPVALTATVNANADVTSVSWTTSPEGIVEVDRLSLQDGVTTLSITPKAGGQATLTITTDGKDENGEKITKTVAITVTVPDPNAPKDLSADGTANCYIVSEGPGNYMFKPVKGNSAVSVGKVASATILWESRNRLDLDDSIAPGTVVSDAGLTNDGYIWFTANEFGSALIAALDANNTILWSWHIWVWPGYNETKNFNTYKNGAGYLMDRDLGADNNYPTTATLDRSAYGLLYQWGRKDPFFGSDKRAVAGQIPYPQYSSAMVDGVRVGTVEYATAHPGVYIMYDPNQTHMDWLYSSLRDNSLWGNTKTIYDPCPPGWKVPSTTFWQKVLGTSANDSYLTADNERLGLDFSGIMSNDTKVFYPASGCMKGDMDYSYYSPYGDIWGPTRYGYWWTCGPKTTNPDDDNYDYAVLLVIKATPREANPYAGNFRSHACSVRCMWDSSTSPQGVQPQDVPVTSVTLNLSSKAVAVGDTFTLTATVKPDNASNKAVTWSSTNPSVASVTSSGFVEAKAAGKATIKATSKADPNMVGSCIVTVGDPTQGEVVDLGASETANCYIVSAPGKYKFPATFKGNSTTATIAPASAQWLWQSYCTSASSGADIISEVSLQGDYVTFTVPADIKNGNALIAAKDASGNVLWSWHIWCCAAYDAVESAQTYYDGSVVMDRNVGATSATPGNIGAMGLLYQWGRKDPFLNAYNPANQFASTAGSQTQSMSWSVTPTNESLGTNPLAYSILYPMHFIIAPSSKDWMKIGNNNENPNLWSSTSKTMYDPCPPGWMVPAGGPNGLWANAFAASPDQIAYMQTEEYKSNPVKLQTSDYNTNSTFGARYVKKFYDGTIWFPFAGQIWGHQGNFGETVGKYLRVWSGTSYSSGKSYMLSQDANPGFSFNGAQNRAYGMSVRCVKVKAAQQ